MTLDEAIKICEEVAEEQEKAAKEWHENQVRKCELFHFAEMDYTHENECKECVEEHRQLAEWLKELKQYKEQEPSETIHGSTYGGVSWGGTYKPQEPKTGWIPVSERLPEEREWYLAVFREIDTGFQLIPRVADYIGGGENKWQIIDEEGLCQEYRDILECVAWMPLPKAYKKEGD